MALYQINGSNGTPTLIPGTLGRVVDYTIREERIMSDVWDNVYYATVMNADGTVTTHRVGVCGCKVLTGEVDAEEEVVAAYQKYLTKNKIDALRKDMERALFDERKRQATPKRGLLATVVKGRKVKIGTHGEIRWIGENRFGVSVGISVDGSSSLVFVNPANIKVHPNPTEFYNAMDRIESMYLTAIALLETEGSDFELDDTRTF